MPLTLKPATGSGQMTLISVAGTTTNDTLTLPAKTGNIITSADSGTVTAGMIASLPAGAVIQVINYQTGAVATGTTQIPSDDTIPQNTEGDEYMTLAVTPKSATSKLKIDVLWFGECSAAGTLTMALFQDSIANALAATAIRINASAYRNTFTLVHYMTSGTTSSTTFKIRCGLNAAATTTFNGAAGARLYGGVIPSSITIMEIAA
jgi:hypothetical protein